MTLTAQVPTQTTRDATVPLIAPPPGAEMVCAWESHLDNPYRSVFGPDRLITDSNARVYYSVNQLSDGTLADGDIFAPAVYVSDGEREGLTLNSDQARELAAALLESAAELDGWVNR